jgi:hypothetical protein
MYCVRNGVKNVDTVLRMGEILKDENVIYSH